MSFESSMIYTMGTALNRALEDSADVAILINGLWLSGRVVMYDGVGVVLDNRNEHTIVRVDNIGAVRVLTQPPWHPKIADNEAPMAQSGEAMPMPGPRAPGNG